MPRTRTRAAETDAAEGGAPMEQDEAALEGDTKKFGHLLKPIRDMAENWNIDIATELTGYLEELDALRINIEGGDLGLNFAEAALVIQGSTMVYSRKVEFLYSLVFQTLDLLCDAREEETDAAANGKKRRKARKSLADVGVEERELFLLLDDVIPIAQNTLLKPNEGKRDRSQGLRERVPIALLAGRAGQGDRNAAFNMMNCGIDAAGAFILEKGRPTVRDRAHGRDNDAGSDAGAGLGTPGSPGSADGGFFFHGNDSDDGAMDDCNDDIPTGFQSPSEQETALGLRQGATAPPSTDLQRKRTAMRPGFDDDDDAGDLDFDAAGGDFDEDDLEDGESEATDPWARLDPHQEGRASDQRPLKPGKTWKVPASLRKDAASGAGAAPLDRTYRDLLFSVAANPRLIARLPLRPDMVLFPEFRAYASERRRALRETRRAKRAAANELDEDADEQAGRVDDEEEAAAMHLAFDNVADGDLESNGPGDNDDDDMYHGGGDLDFGGYGSEDDGPAGFDARPGLHLDEAVLESSAPDSYVDMVRAHLQRYMESANQWASESKLHARVRQWEDKIEPFLESQNERPPFDIHDYGERILSRFRDVTAETSNENGEVAFADLTAHLGALSTEPSDASSSKARNRTMGAEDDQDCVEQFEVCRAFLASLQLANNGNVELVHETNNSALRVKVVDSVLANKKLETYRAPSIRNDDQSDRVEVDLDDEEDEEDEDNEDEDEEEEEEVADDDGVEDRSEKTVGHRMPDKDDLEAASDASSLQEGGAPEDDVGPTSRAAKKAKIAASPARTRHQRI